MSEKRLREDMARMQEYVEKTLHVLCKHVEAYNARSSRVYYPLNDGWGLTRLDTGQPFYVSTHDRHVTPWVIMGGHWEPNVDKVLTGYAQPGDMVLDIGAHIGYYTIKLGSRVRPNGGRVIAFEPNPKVNEYAEANIRLNGFFGHVNVEKFALGDRVGTVRLTQAAYAMASANIVGDMDEGDAFEVEMRALDSLDIQRPVDLIKLDAEGAEVMVLKGGRELLKRSPSCAVVMELGMGRWERFAPFAEVIELCGGNGRKLYGIHQDGTIEQMGLAEARAFICTGHFQEEYVLIAHEELVEKRIPALVRRPSPPQAIAAE